MIRSKFISTLISMASMAVVSLAMLTGSPLHAAIIAFNSATDADTATNTSGTTPYAPNPPSTPAVNPGGIATASTTDTQTYFFMDPTTMIKYNYDLTFTTGTTDGSAAANLGGNANHLGVGDVFISGVETMSVAVSNLSVDLSMYVAGSFMGFQDVCLTDSGFGFNNIAFASYTQIADPADGTESVLDVTYTPTGGTASSVTHTDNDAQFHFGTGGNGDGFTFPDVNSDGGSATFFVDPSSGDANIRYTSTLVRVELDLAEKVVPEPSAGLLCLLAACPLLATRRRR